MASSSSKRKREDEEEEKGKAGVSSNSFDITDEQLNYIVRMIRTTQSRHIPAQIFSAELAHVNTRFNHQELIYNITVGSNNMNSLPELLENFRRVFQYLINVMKYHANSDRDKARFYISKAPKDPFSTAILNVGDFTPQLFFNIFERHMQSNAQEVIDNGWQSIVSIYIFPNSYLRPRARKAINRVKMYQGMGKNQSEAGSARTARKHGRDLRNGVFQVAGNSIVKQNCFALALLLGKSFLQKDKHYEIANVNRNVDLATLYTTHAITNVYKAVGIPVGPVRVDQCDLFYKKYLLPDNIDLVVFSKSQQDSIVYDSRLDGSEHIHRLTNNVIFLWLNDAHYDLIVSPPHFSKVNSSKYCFICMRYYSLHEVKETHICKTVNTCRSCYSNETRCVREADFKIECTHCHVLFYNSSCFERHLTKRIFQNSYSKAVTPCIFFIFCKTCYKKVPRMLKISSKKTTRHNCDEMYCKQCDAIKKKDHGCYIKVYKIPKKSTLPILYFYDFETRVDSNGYMVPFYAVVQKVCEHCDRKDFKRLHEGFTPHTTYKHCDVSIEKVPCCGYRQYIFENNNADIVEMLLDFMFAEQADNSVWIAHNGGRFDSIFILRELLVKRGIVPQVVMSGNKIMCMKIEQQQRKIRLIDSYLFITMRLSKMPEAMGIPNLTKGYHPYHFTDLNYIGDMVGLEYFDLVDQSVSERNIFDQWYTEQQKKLYVFREAIYYYCGMDVDILRQCCVKFAQLIVDITGIFPFYDQTCHTIAGLALKIYRANFLTEETIGQIPATGYGGNVNQSVIALCWLSQLRDEGLSLRSKLSPEGEEKILNRFVDGYCAETNTIYQFHGCFFHGCRNCFDGEDFNKVTGDRYYFLREKTQRTTQLFKDFGYHVVEKWECDFIREGKFVRSTLTQLRHTDYFVYLNLNPRDALFGGRTSPAKLYFESKGDAEKGRYYDYTSLYPHVQKKFRYPIKHPVITRGIEKCSKLEVAKIFGLIKCKILPPKTMLFPVLPVRLEKLTFALCATCAREQCKKCTHNDEQRALLGTWTSVEVHTALEHGYKMLTIYEVYHYPNSKKIFDLYVDTFMKLKQESNGVPKNCLGENGVVDDVKLCEYIEEYASHEQVRLDKSNIKSNPGQRTVMKALLNSLWGKLAQNEDTTVVTFVDSLNELLSLVNDHSIEVTSLDFISDNIARTTYRKTGSLITLGNRNVIIASFVTAYACLELFKALHKLQENVLYYDTDSVIYVEDLTKGRYLETGRFLGQMTDELSDSRSTEKWIEQFSSAGPKSYSYRTNEYVKTLDDGSTIKQRDEITHVKGFSLRGDAKKKTTFDSITSCVRNKEQEIEITYRELTRSNMQTIAVENNTKKFRFTFDKRVVCDDFSTVPFGYMS
jgi:hypothetical protein